MNKKSILLWLLQLIPAAILLMAAWAKFMSAPGPLYTFTVLKMDHGGMILIGVLEIIAAVFLILPRFSAVGALLGAGIMFGAIIAHLTRIGIIVQNDGGLSFALASTVLITTSVILWFRRNELPIIGKTL